MASITRVQNFSNDTVTMLAVQGTGTDKFQASGQPERPRANFGVVLTGDLRVTKSDTSRGYFFLLTGVSKNSDRKRTFFRGDALVRCGSAVYTVENYYRMLLQNESI